MRVLVNCAMTADGKIASRERRQVTISSEEDMLRVHRLRNDSDAILVGVGTVIADDPSLLVKEKYVPEGKKPIRVVIDPCLRTPHKSRLLQGDAPTLIYSCKKGVIVGAEVVSIPGPPIQLQLVLEDLEKRGVKKLLVEGGGETIWNFLDQGMVDEYHVFIGNLILGGRNSPTPADGDGRLASDKIELELVSTEILGQGVLLAYMVKKC